MATGGVFQIITNDGKQDRMLMATALLNRRLALIEEARSKDPLVSDSTPTLLDIEKTHILFMNAHFKPFAAIGYEYNKVNPQSSTSSLGGEVQFSIPQFGDFFGDMAVHVLLTAPTVSRTTNFGLTDASTATQGAGHAAAFRWCHYPGERLFDTVKFDVNGNPLDEYTSLSVNLHREFAVQPNKKLSWFRCVGQEVPMDGYLRQPGVDLTGQKSDGSSTGLINAGAAPVSHRVCERICNGPQTPKSTPDNLEMWIPLLFWFNKDPRLVIPSVSIPHGQRYITLKLTAATNMYGLVPRGVGTWTDPKATLTAATNEVAKMELYINNIFVNPEVHDIFIKRIGFSLIRVHRESTNSLSNSSDEILLNKMKWPIETMYVGVKVSAYATGSHNLDKWHTFGRQVGTDYNVSQVLSGQLSTAAQGIAQTASGNTLAISTAGVLTVGAASAFPTWLAAGDTISAAGYICTIVSVDSVTQLTVVPAPTVALAFAAVTGVSYPISKFANPKVTCNVFSPTVDTLSVSAHGIPLYNNIENEFFSDYVPYAYGGSNISSPEDRGLLMINFCIYPGTYQPSSHINVSRAREFYFKYTSSVIGAVATELGAGVVALGTLAVVASAINFLLITDGQELPLCSGNRMQVYINLRLR
jgi:hypothetical protein